MDTPGISGKDDMDIVVGNKCRLALEFVPEPGSQGGKDGNLFLYLNGKRFGENRYQYPVYGFIRHVTKYYQKEKMNFPDLFNCSGKTIIDALEAYIYYDFDEDEKVFHHPILRAVPSFLDDVDDIDDCIFRYVHYAFDRCLIVIIPYDDAIKISIRDDDTGEHEEVISTYREFYGLWVELKLKIRNH